MKKNNISKTLTRTLSSIALCGALAFSQSALAENQEKPVLVVGASIENGVTPISNDLQGPFGGFALNFGSYIGLGDALQRDPKMSGFVINEAVAGATTFTRDHCPPTGTQCFPTGWQGMDVQFDKALTRVAMRDATGAIVAHNADFVVIGTPNDCLHSGAAGVVQSESAPCTYAEIDASIDNLKAIGEKALSLGITPVYTVMPKYNDLDLPLFRDAFGLVWVIDEAGYNDFRARVQSRITAELPGAAFVDVWEEFTHMGDGIHPNYDATEKAGKRLAQALLDMAK